MRRRAFLAKVDSGAAFKQAEGKTTGHALKLAARLACLQLCVGGQGPLDLFAQPFIDTFEGGFPPVGFCVLCADELQPGGEPVRAGFQSGDVLTFPGDAAAVSQREGLCRGARDLSQPLSQDRAERRDGCGPHGLAFQCFRGRGWLKVQADQAANDMALDSDFSGLRQFGQKQIFPFQSRK